MCSNFRITGSTGHAIYIENKMLHSIVIQLHKIAKFDYTEGAGSVTIK